MIKIKIMVVLFFLVLHPLFANPQIIQDSLRDITNIPQISEVVELEKKANKAFGNKSWEEAASLYKELAFKSEFIAYIIGMGLKPLETLEYEIDDGFLNTNSIRSDYNTMYNFNARHNKAVLRQGICLYEIGDLQGALSLLVEAMKKIDGDSPKDWAEGRKYLYLIIGYEKFFPLY